MVEVDTTTPERIIRQLKKERIHHDTLIIQWEEDEDDRDLNNLLTESHIRWDRLSGELMTWLFDNLGSYTIDLTK